LLLLEREPDMSMEMDQPMVVATWENRTQIIEIMGIALQTSQEFQHLWQSSGGTGRLSQDDTDKLVELLRQIGNLNEMLMRLA
jgi:phage terminase Nu1 subunit (DNA packaging protein)